MNTPVISPIHQPDLDAVKARQRLSWSAGDYSAVGTTLQIVGEQLCETIDLRAGSRVLDVAAGNGNATLAAARRFCNVTSTDYVDALLERGRERALAERLNVIFQEADAEAMPFAAVSFDVVLSTFGVMFTADHVRAASELLRVCRPGGVIAMSNWTPESFIGRVFRIISHHIPPAAGVMSPSRWGTREAINGWFASSARSIDFYSRTFNFRYLSADHFLTWFREYYGPVQKAYLALGDTSARLDADLRQLLHTMNVATDGTLVVPSAYVEVVIQKA